MYTNLCHFFRVYQFVFFFRLIIISLSLSLSPSFSFSLSLSLFLSAYHISFFSLSLSLTIIFSLTSSLSLSLSLSLYLLPLLLLIYGRFSSVFYLDVLVIGSQSKMCLKHAKSGLKQYSVSWFFIFTILYIRENPVKIFSLPVSSCKLYNSESFSFLCLSYQKWETKSYRGGS